MFLTTRLLLLMLTCIGSSWAFSLWGRSKVNCGVSLWSEWSKSSDGTSRTRDRKVFRKPKRGGVQCPVLSETETNPWNTKRTAGDIAPALKSSLLSARKVAVDTNIRHRGPPGNIILPRDMLFIVDMSGSIGAASFEQTKSNIAALVGQICGDIGPGRRQNRVAVVTFSFNSYINFRFSDYTTLKEVQDAIQSIPYESQNTCLHKGLENAVEVFRTAKGMRGDAYSVKEVVLLTDGEWNCGAEDSEIYNWITKLSQLPTDLDSNARPIAIYAFLIGDFAGNIQDKFDKIITTPAQDHLFVFLNIKVFNDAVKIISDHADDTDECVSLDYVN